MNEICVSAGKNVYEIIQDSGFDFDSVATYVGAASGPRWLVASGFDLSLLKSGVLGNKRPTVLAGSSAGAMRFSAWMQPEPEKSYEKLIEAYIAMNFTRKDTPETILQSIRNLIDFYIDDDALSFALTNRKYRLAITTVRAKRLAASNVRWLQGLALGTGFVCNALNRRMIHRFFQRVVFHNSPILPYFCLNHDFRGQTIPLNEANFKHALLASSAVPLAAAGVRDIYGAPGGMYRDGGLTDYHLNQKYSGGKGAITLMFNHQKRIIPTWMDKRLPSRQPPREYLEDVLMVHPSDDFIRKLPYNRVPDRGDFKRYADNPSKRIRGWKRAVVVSEHLGEQFLELVENGRLRDVVEKM
ncbi:MAG: patatin-like phospholipase family protein [Deltaproteobacteria bacterium]|nr:patatin-like phospholipase family protein [Deltaproteobacteria bacterium]MBW2595696.1 patatin-like phospholipase family protein [Deltaproteobacteria bacterium]